jgi:hypothetical protein
VSGEGVIAYGLEHEGYSASLMRWR